MAIIDDVCCGACATNGEFLYRQYLQMLYITVPGICIYGPQQEKLLTR